jgi:hypothetical protein
MKQKHFALKFRNCFHEAKKPRFCFIVAKKVQRKIERISPETSPEMSEQFFYTIEASA